MTKAELKYYEKLKQKKYRDSERKFLIEGIHLVEECIKSEKFKNNIEKIFIDKNFTEVLSFQNSGNKHQFTKIVRLDEKDFNKLTETVNSQGIIGVVNKLSPVKNIDSNGLALTVALDNINDPGNLGTIIRTCYWFGVTEVLISRNSSDLYNSKVIRSSQGSIFHLNIRNELNIENELEEYFKKGFCILLSEANGKIPSADLKNFGERNTVIVFGNEANGISKSILRNPDYHSVAVKGFTQCESLNVAVAAGIILNDLKNG